MTTPLPDEYLQHLQPYSRRLMEETTELLGVEINDPTAVEVCGTLLTCTEIIAVEIAALRNTIWQAHLESGHR